MVYTKEFLISELQRFKLLNDRVPTRRDMNNLDGYISHNVFYKFFGSWNNALIEAELKVNKGSLDGNEVCDNCGKTKPENQGWYYINEQRLCLICSQNLNNYKNGNLDPDSNVGFAFLSQRIVAKTLDLDLKYDCNCSIGFTAPYDLLDEDGYGYINVKTSALYKNNVWSFRFKNKQIPDTYILLGFSADKSDIEHVWITEPEDDLTFDEQNCKIKQSIKITNSEKGLRRAKSWEVDCEPYNDAYHSMSLENCSVLRSD